MEQCRKLVRDEDISSFDEIIEPFKVKVMKALDDFGFSQLHYAQDSDLNMEFSSLSLDDQIALVPSNEEETIRSWETLLDDLKELQSLASELYTATHTQQETLEGVEHHIEEAHIRVEDGKHQLSKASFLKAAMLPVAGALVGGAVGLAVGGPIGLAIGSKLAFFAVTTGGVVAGTSAGVAAKKIQKSNNSKKND